MCEKMCLESRRFYDRFYLVSVFWFEKNGFKVFATKFLLNYSDTHGTQSYYGKIIKHKAQHFDHLFDASWIKRFQC